MNNFPKKSRRFASFKGFLGLNHKTKPVQVIDIDCSNTKEMKFITKEARKHSSCRNNHANEIEIKAGRVVLRRDSFTELQNETESRRKSSCIRSLVSAPFDINRNEKTGALTNALMNDIDVNSVLLRRGRRNAIAEASPRDRQDILAVLRKRWLARSLVDTGLVG